MFLSRRATQAEYFDDLGRPEAEIVEAYSSLAYFNRLFFFARPFQLQLPKLLEEEKCASLSILDLGAGDGSLGIFLKNWASKRGWQWQFTNLDVCESGLRLCKSNRNVTALATALPFRDASFDVVIASQMTHHMADEQEVTRHFREAWRVTRDALIIADLNRNPFLYATVWLLLQLRRHPKHFHDDALLSVRRAFRRDEFGSLAKQAGINNARVSLYYAARIILQARKS